MTTGDATESIEANKDRLVELERMRRELEAMLVKVDKQVQDLRRSSEPTKLRLDQSEDFVPKRRNWAQSAREMVLDALADLEWPAYTRECATLIEARLGRKIPATRFGTLAADEVAAYLNKGSDSRSVWVCFSLTADRYEPIKRLLARSDWPLERRIHALTTGRLQHLWMTKRFCELAMKADEIAVDPEMLRILAADHARDLPGVSVRKGIFDFESWRDVAGAQIAELEPRDEALRKKSAARLAQRPELFQLFGLPEVIEGDRDVALRERERA